jgi:hypothetical protein
MRELRKPEAGEGGHGGSRLTIPAVFRLSNGVTTASFALIERVDQFLNERTQYRRVAFTFIRSTDFAPVPFVHIVSHISSPTIAAANPESL